MKKITILFLAFSGFLMTAPAKTFYVDPVNGAPGNDGSMAKPWRTLREVFSANLIESRMYTTKPYASGAPLSVKNSGAPVKAGDTLLLKSGYHDTLNVAEYYNTDYITVMAAPGEAPRLGFIQLRSAAKWRIQGLTISPSFLPVFKRKTLINFESHSWTGASFDCIAEACTAYTVMDASAWRMGQWDSLSCDGISMPGTKMIARGNYFKNVNFGINVSGDSCRAEHNTVENFAGDGMRGLGDYDIFEYNRVTGCYAVNANHDDGFQSWSVGDSGVGTGVVKGLVLRGNTIINYVDANQPFRGTLQGIGCFDGMFEDWLVENNVIITDHWHGITLLGAKNCVVINNTVVDQNNASPGPPWIMVAKHKDGRAATGCIVRNNLATDFASDSTVAGDHNIRISSFANYANYFVNYAGFDLHIKKGCAAVDSGSATLAPAVDIAGTVRPQGTRVDVGAYEYDSRIGVETAAHLVTYGGIECWPNPVTGGRAVIHTPSVGAGGRSPLHGGVPLRAAVYDVHGRRVAALSAPEFIWDTRRLPSGIYVLKVTAGPGHTLTKRVVVQR